MTTTLCIEKLFKEEREVGKTIKGTKKYYLWEFVLNGIFHKVEVYHSKMSGKKKLCVDAQQMSADKGYQSSFTYSFRIDKAYMNIAQLGMDKFELSVDNQPFDRLIAKEKAGKLKAIQQQEASNLSVKKVNVKIPQVQKAHQENNSQKNDFYHDQNGFDFSGGKVHSESSIVNQKVKARTVVITVEDKPQTNSYNLLDFESKQEKLAQPSIEPELNLNQNIMQADLLVQNQNVFPIMNLFTQETENKLPIDNAPQQISYEESVEERQARLMANLNNLNNYQPNQQLIQQAQQVNMQYGQNNYYNQMYQPQSYPLMKANMNFNVNPYSSQPQSSIMNYSAINYQSKNEQVNNQFSQDFQQKEYYHQQITNMKPTTNFQKNETIVNQPEEFFNIKPTQKIQSQNEQPTKTIDFNYNPFDF